MFCGDVSCSCAFSLYVSVEHASLDGGQEFGNGSSTEAEGKSFAAAVNETKADGKTRTNELETVVRISGSSATAKKEAEHAANASASAAAAAAADGGGGGAGGASAASTASGGSGGGGGGGGGIADLKEEEAAEVEKSVDRIIDSHDNEFVLSKSGSGLASLTLDPQVGLIHPDHTLSPAPFLKTPASG